MVSMLKFLFNISGLLKLVSDCMMIIKNEFVRVGFNSGRNICIKVC